MFEDTGFFWQIKKPPIPKRGTRVTPALPPALPEKKYFRTTWTAIKGLPFRLSPTAPKVEGCFPSAGLHQVPALWGNFHSLAFFRTAKKRLFHALLKHIIAHKGKKASIFFGELQKKHICYFNEILMDFLWILFTDCGMIVPYKEAPFPVHKLCPRTFITSDARRFPDRRVFLCLKTAGIQNFSPIRETVWFFITFPFFLTISRILCLLLCPYLSYVNHFKVIGYTSDRKDSSFWIYIWERVCSPKNNESWQKNIAETPSRARGSSYGNFFMDILSYFSPNTNRSMTSATASSSQVVSIT